MESKGGRFVCGTLEASRQGDGGQTVLSSVEIEDGVYGTCGWVDHPTDKTYDTANSPKPDQEPPANPAVGDVYYTYPLISTTPGSTTTSQWEQTNYQTNYDWFYSEQSEDWHLTDNDTKRWRLEYNHTEDGEQDVYEWVVTSSGWNSGTSVPASQPKPHWFTEGDSYTTITNSHNVGDRIPPVYEWFYTTYTYQKTGTEPVDVYYYDRVDQELQNRTIPTTIYHQGEVKHEYEPSGENSDYILDNLVVADVGSLASIAIPDIPGVDAHNCHINGKSGAKIKIGGRDFLNELQADWGTTKHLCLYGNGIGVAKNVEHGHGNNDSWLGHAFIYKSGSGRYDTSNGVWSQLGDDAVVLKGITLSNDKEAGPVKIKHEIDFYYGFDENLNNAVFWSGSEDVGSYKQIYYYDYTPAIGYDWDHKSWDTSPSPAESKTKKNLKGKWSNYKDNTKIYVVNWCTGLSCSTTIGKVTVCPFGD